MTSDETRPDLRFCTCGAEAGHAGSERCPLVPPRLQVDEREMADAVMADVVEPALAQRDAEIQRLRAFVEDWDSMVPVDCDKHAVAIDDGDGGSYVCPICQRDEARRVIAAVEALCDEGPGSVLDPTHGYVSLRRLRAALSGDQP